ncbi:MAG: thioredoxin family protein [Sphingobacteriales bacterium]|nr:MAG: thioredoxin family protein [Sphingobacteriales bacterium]
MKALCLTLFSLFILSAANAQPHTLQDALQVAQKEHKLVLLRFSGSDWCIPCIRMEKELFNDAAFHNYADSSLVLLAADFPRLKKHKLPADQQAENDRLAERYNPQGEFPLLVLLDEKGTILRRWEGYVAEKPNAFVGELAAQKGR